METKTFTATCDWLHLPVDNHALATQRCLLKRVSDDAVVAYFDVAIAGEGAAPDWYARCDVRPWRGEGLRLEAPDGVALGGVLQDDRPWLAGKEYDAERRPRYHFTAGRGWTNDPNGLCYFNGEYHLFFQHNPYGIQWGNMHWGHAVSKDLVHWEELGDVLAPDELGSIFSGSAVVDAANRSGLGEKAGAPVMALFYTAAGRCGLNAKTPHTQCLAFSQDGRSFQKYHGNPVVPYFSDGNRDPKVYWHEETKRWVMVYYVTTAERRHAFRFMASTDLRTWEELSVLVGDPVLVDGGAQPCRFLFECPDFFELSCEDGTRKWVIFGANGLYGIGDFDGRKFTIEKRKSTGVQGDLYAAQTYFGMPDGRRVLIGWLRGAVDEALPFSQAMSVPMELGLRKCADGGLRMSYRPAKELGPLFHVVQERAAAPLPGGERVSLGEMPMSARVELRCALEESSCFEAILNGVKVTYDADARKVTVGEAAYDWLSDDNSHFDVTIFLDRSSIELFSADGATYIARLLVPRKGESTLRIYAGAAKSLSCTVAEYIG